MINLVKLLIIATLVLALNYSIVSLAIAAREQTIERNNKQESKCLY